MPVDRTALFTRDDSVSRLRSRLRTMPAQFPVLPDPDLLWDALMAAEGEAARKLGVFLQPTEVFPIVAPPAAVAALPAGMPYVVEPAYDLPPDWFQVGMFGALKLNHPLVSKVTSLELRHPSYQAEAYIIPAEWVQLVGRSGMINVIPGGGGLSNLPLGVFTLQAIGSGYTIPHMIRVRYTAGLGEPSEFRTEIVALVYRAAAMRLLLDQFIPQSTSISADGLSQSRSQDLGKHQEAIDMAFESLRDRLHGPVWGVL